MDADGKLLCHSVADANCINECDWNDLANAVAICDSGGISIANADAVVIRYHYAVTKHQHDRICIAEPNWIVHCIAVIVAVSDALNKPYCDCELDFK